MKEDSSGLVCEYYFLSFYEANERIKNTLILNKHVRSGLIDTHANFLAGVLGTLFALSLEGSFLTSQQVVSVLVDLKLGDDTLRGIDGDVDGGTYTVIASFTIDKSIPLSFCLVSFSI